MIFDACAEISIASRIDEIESSENTNLGILSILEL